MSLVCRGKLVDQTPEQLPGCGLQPVRVEPRKSEHGVGAGAQRELRVERADDLVEQAASGADNGGHPRRREDVAQRPDRAADVVADVRLVEPAAVVAHEVAHPALWIGRVLEKCERAVDDRRPRLLVAAPCELQRDDREPRHVVDAVAALAVRDHAVRMLDDADVVDEREQVIGAHAHELRVEPGERPPAAWRQLDRLAQDGRRRLGDGRPRELRSDPTGFRAGGGESIRLFDVAADGIGERRGVVERHDLPGARREHVLRVPVRSRDDRTTGSDSECERARGDLLAPLVRRHEDVRCGEQVGDLLDRQEAVVELDVILEAELEHRLLELEPVALAFAMRHVGVRAAGHHVEHLRMTCDDRGQRLDHGFDPLAGRDQPEGREHEPVVLRRALPGENEGAGGGAACKEGRRSVRDDANLVLRARLAGHEQPLRRLGHHDHELGLAAQGREHPGLMRRGLGEHCVQCDDEGLREILGQREHVGAVVAAEDPVLVLEQDDVDVEPAEDPGCANVVASNRLRDRGHEPRPLRAGRVVDDDDLLDAVDPVDPEQRGAHVGRKGADPAGTRRVGGDDRGAHGLGRALP